MKMEQSFEVAAPIDVVWKALIDVERVAPCLPGAQITERDDEGNYHGTFQVKLGPTTAAYRGTLKIGELDEAGHVATLHARGTDKRGQGGATATIVNRLTEVDGGTRVDAETDFTITGRLARFGRGGMMEDISNRLLREFAECLQSKLAAGPAPVAGTGASGAEGAPVPPAGAGAGPAAASEPARGPESQPAAARPVSGISLFLGVLWERIKRLFTRRR